MWRCPSRYEEDEGQKHEYSAPIHRLKDDDGLALPIEVLHKSVGKGEESTLKMFLPIYEIQADHWDESNKFRFIS